MTQQVRTGYRNHRKAAWGLTLLLVAAIATVAIPFASGAGGPTKTLKFARQPPAALQKSTPATTASVAVAVFSGGPNPQNSQGQEPSLDRDRCRGDDRRLRHCRADVQRQQNFWTWSVTPNSNARSGLYNFVARIGDLAPRRRTRSAWRSSSVHPRTLVRQHLEPAPPEPRGSSRSRTRSRVRSRSTSSSTLAWVPVGCDGEAGQTWNRLFYEDANGNNVYFPAVALNFTWGNQMLQVTYMVRNSEWILSNAARGNNDIEFCAEARHQTADWNGDGGNPRPFAGKYGPSTWDPSTGMYSGVLTTVSNPSKVKTNGTGSPAVCGRGNQDIDGETWRTWTVCIPFDWDYKFG